RRRHTRSKRDWSSDVCSSDLWGQSSSEVSPHVQESLLQCCNIDVPRCETVVDGLSSGRPRSLAEREGGGHHTDGREGLMTARDEIGRASCRERAEVAVVRVIG